MSAERSWEALHERIDREVGVILFTVLVFTHEGARMERIHSSHPIEYPVGGWKDVATEVSPDWIAATRDSAGVFVAHTAADLDRIFGDAELIRSLGCGSIVNIPLRRADGSNWATVNICGPERAYTPERIALAERIVGETAPAEESVVSDTASEKKEDSA